MIGTGGLRPKACSLQPMVEASMGRFWTVEGETMVPQVSNLVETFMAAKRYVHFPSMFSHNAGLHRRRI